MTTCTACGNTCVVHRCTSFEAGRIFVTSLASRSSRNMGRRFGFYRSESTTVTS
jgi:hypothetical protein